jgi:hypothetical protein
MTDAEMDAQFAIIDAQLDRLVSEYFYVCSEGCGYHVATPGPCGECLSGS